MRIFSSLPAKTDGTLYLVFVTRAGNKLGGAVMGNRGLYPDGGDGGCAQRRRDRRR